jgi:hypothetical protein
VEPFVDEGDRGQNDEPDYGQEDARLQQRGAVRSAAAVQDSAEAPSDAGEDERTRNEPDESASNEGGQAVSRFGLSALGNGMNYFHPALTFRNGMFRKCRNWNS